LRFRVDGAGTLAPTNGFDDADTITVTTIKKHIALWLQLKVQLLDEEAAGTGDVGVGIVDEVTDDSGFPSIIEATGS